MHDRGLTPPSAWRGSAYQSCEVPSEFTQLVLHRAELEASSLHSTGGPFSHCLDTVVWCVGRLVSKGKERGLLCCFSHLVVTLQPCRGQPEDVKALQTLRASAFLYPLSLGCPLPRTFSRKHHTNMLLSPLLPHSLIHATQDLPLPPVPPAPASSLHHFRGDLYPMG